MDTDPRTLTQGVVLDSTGVEAGSAPMNRVMPKVRRVRDYIRVNRSSLLLFCILVAFVFLVRLPAHYEISIDDIGKFATDEPYNKLIDGAAAWNRWMTVSLASISDAIGIPFRVFLFSGSIVADVLLVAFCFRLCLFFSPNASPLTIVAVTLVVALFPPLFVLVHFHLIGYSLAATFVVLIWILHAANSPRVWALPVAITLGAAVVAGSYQSGLYWYALIVLAVTLRSALTGLAPFAVLKQFALHGVCMMAGLIIYSVLGAILSIGVVESKHSLASVSEMLTLLEARLDPAYFSWHFRDMTYFPKSLKLLASWHAVFLFVASLVLAARKSGYALAVGVFAFAVLMCAIQVLMIPYNYTHVPIRSFWWFGLFYALSWLVFQFASRNRRNINHTVDDGHAQSLPSIGFKAVNLAVFLFVGLCFAVSTYRLGDGLTAIRTLDDARAAVVLDALNAQGFQNDRPIVLALGDRQRVDAMHSEALGATKTLFWAGWTRVPFLNTRSDMQFREAPGALFEEGRKSCLASPPIGPMPRVTIEAEYVLVCL